MVENSLIIPFQVTCKSKLNHISLKSCWALANTEIQHAKHAFFILEKMFIIRQSKYEIEVFLLFYQRSADG